MVRLIRCRSRPSVIEKAANEGLRYGTRLLLALLSMTRRIQNPPLPPRGLTSTQAAAYVGAPSVEVFEREAKAGIWPAPFQPNSRPKRWDRDALDLAMDRQSGIARNHSVASEKSFDLRSDGPDVFEERARNFSFGKARA